VPAFADRMRIKEPKAVLKEEEKKKIHEAALDVMANVGIRVHSKVAKASLKDAGATVDEGNGVVTFPEGLIDSLISKAPRNFTLAGREKEFDLPLDGRHCYYTTDGCGVAVWDQKTRTRRLSVLQDIKDSATIADYLRYLSIYEPMVVASDMPEKTHVIASMKEAFDISSKHIASESTSTSEEARVQVRMASEIVGGIEELRKRHIISAMVCTMSPLTLDEHATDAAMVWADAHVPIHMCGMAMMGMSGPATIAGDLVVNHAETLALAAAVQAHTPGAPIMYGSVLSNMDPRTGAIQFEKPEAMLLCMSAKDMADYVKMPSAAGGFGTDAKVPGMQSALENGMMAFANAIVGQEVNNGIGMLDCSNVLSYEQMVIDDDIVGRSLRGAMGVDVTDETLHLDLIKDVGILGMGPKKGSYLGERATMMEVREFYVSTLFPSETFEQWSSRGAKDDIILAKEKADWILANHKPKMLGKDISQRLGQILKEAGKS
jgi:trimethylamine--corrinoid protein Co-methyltransferase